ncbi:MAG: hypothetical protein J5764_00060 [Bacteroidales bacterium]|nr:hypothetical protein [Bacteroidales bacterium]
MKKLKAILLLMTVYTSLFAQETDSWTVEVLQMAPERRQMINETVEKIQEQDGDTRSILAGMLLSAGQAGVTALVDVAATEVVKLINLRKTQKKAWLKMIENECNYTDSISSIRGLKDFYSENSRFGALDPSNINFDGVRVRGVRDGREVLFLSCSIDTSRLYHLFQHSKFYLVVDTIAFHPYECHLPNLGANGIVAKGAAGSKRNNKFSYAEREHLTIGMDLSLSSSWINEAVMIQKDEELGKFKMQVDIPSGTEVYTYSRAAIDRNRKLLAEGAAPEGVKIDTSYVTLNGDCFVVPRSYMPVTGGTNMWGTGEYNMKVRFRESCRFSKDATHNEKMKHWNRDYRQLRKMQRKGSDFTEYMRNLWEQNGNTLMKSMIKSGLTTGTKEAGISK